VICPSCNDDGLDLDWPHPPCLCPIGRKLADDLREMQKAKEAEAEDAD